MKKKISNKYLNLTEKIMTCQWVLMMGLAVEQVLLMIGERKIQTLIATLTAIVTLTATATVTAIVIVIRIVTAIVTVIVTAIVIVTVVPISNEKAIGFSNSLFFNVIDKRIII
jgi:alanine-alpha-ketoisovalerate/valine-pyruvate aminotransferase